MRIHPRPAVFLLCSFGQIGRRRSTWICASTHTATSLRSASYAMRARYGSRAVSTPRNAGIAVGSPIIPSARAASRRTSSPAPGRARTAISVGTAARLPICPSERAAERRTNSFSSTLRLRMRSKSPEAGRDWSSASMSGRVADSSAISPSATAAAPRAPALRSFSRTAASACTAVRLFVLPRA